FEPESGQWRHRARPLRPAARLADIRYEEGRMVFGSFHLTEPESALAGYLDEARRIFAEAPAAPAVEADPLPAELEELRWFPLPHEISAELRGAAAPHTQPLLR